jgi:hypothetical protein
MGGQVARRRPLRLPTQRRYNEHRIEDLGEFVARDAAAPLIA